MLKMILMRYYSLTMHVVTDPYACSGTEYCRFSVDAFADFSVVPSPTWILTCKVGGGILEETL